MIRLLLVLALVLTAWGKAPVHVKPHVTKQGRWCRGISERPQITPG